MGIPEFTNAGLLARDGACKLAVATIQARYVSAVSGGSMLLEAKTPDGEGEKDDGVAEKDCSRQ